jgi:ubiquitin-conjugating enzyme E2 D/E
MKELLMKNVKSDPTEAIVVIYDVSGSMSGSFFADKDLSRIGAVNAMFSAFADKTLAYEYNHIVKLVTFNSNITDKCDFISDMDEFILLVDGCKAGGGTSCYDALQYAVMSLIEIKKKYPNIIPRIIALTDGEDGNSKTNP